MLNVDLNDVICQNYSDSFTKVNLGCMADAMLRRFEVENFFSIRERQALDLTVALNAPLFPNRLVSSLPNSTDRIARVAVLFGPNASGKSNILKALAFLVHFSRGSSKWDENSNPPFFTFATKKYRSEPTRLYIEFDAQLIQGKPPCVYSYEVIFKNTFGEAGARAVIEYEAVKYFPYGKPRRLIERKNDKFFASPEFQLKRNDQRLTFIGKTASMFPVLAQFNHQLSQLIIANIQRVQSNVTSLARSEFSAEVMTSYYEKNPQVLAEFRTYVRVMDLGIQNIEIQKLPNGIVPLFTHKGLESPIVLAFESEGTQSLYRIFPPLFFALSVGTLAIIDELDRDIHPLLLPEIVGWFHNPELNKNNAQLVMSCHNATLLEYLIKEEVFLTEKSNNGATELFALQDMKGVRRETNLYAKYLAGIFGSVPRIG